MRLLVVALMLAAAAGGFLLGRLTAHEGSEPRGTRSVQTAPPERQVPAHDAPQHEQPPGERTDDPDPAPGDVVQPSEPCEESGEDGLLLVDLGAQKFAWVGSVDIVGAYEAWELDARDEQAGRFQGAPGTYDVWWLDRDGRRLGTLVRLDAGRVTRLRLAEHNADAPIPRGLGVLSVFVEAAGGGGLSTEVDISDGHYSMDAYTNEDGHASRAIRPGRYTLTVGVHTSNAVVEEGRTTAHRISHGREGDLFVVADPWSAIFVHPAGNPNACWSKNWVGSDGETVPYLAEGEYDLFIPYAFGVPIERATIHPGRTTRVRCEMPTGGVLVRVVPERHQLVIGPLRDGDLAAALHASIQFAAGGPNPVRLMPGRYLVTAHAEGFVSASKQIDVSDRVVEVTLELAPHR